MESLILSFNAVAPIFLMMMLGYLMRRVGIAQKKDFDMVNTLVFKIFLPILLFDNLYTTSNIENFSASIVLFTAIGIGLVFVLGYFFVKVFTKENSRRSTMLQGFFRTNFAILGIPLITSVCGDKVTGLTYLMIAIVVPIFNILAVVCFEIFNAESNNLSIKTLLKGIATNPLLIGCVSGLIFFLLKIKLPFILEKAISDVSKIATPLAIVAIGGSFTFRSIKNCVKEVVTTVFARLVFIPLIAICVAVMLGFRGEALACLLITFGGPIAISSFSMAQQMGGDEDVAANVVVFSSLFCILTMFCWIFALSSLNLF